MSYTDVYTAKELADVLKPIELYHIWFGSTHFYYTDGDRTIHFYNKRYVPAALSRGTISFDSNLEVSQMDITAGRLTDPVISYIAQNPIEIVWIEVLRLFRDQDPLEANPIFLGQIKTVSFQGVSAIAHCVGFEFYLNQPIPKWFYESNCNHRLFDSRCRMDSSSSLYRIETNVVVATDGITLTSGVFNAFTAGWFTYGILQFGAYQRAIVSHIGDEIVIKFRILPLVSGNSVIVLAGCDGKIETCRDKFGNVVNFLGFPYVPEDNPVTWSVG
jgi:uncharacterized phage protein (TIGR02218 family)